MAYVKVAVECTVEDIVTSLLGYRWQHEAEIISEYLPPNPRGNTRPKCVVKHGSHFLRHSRGPGTGTFWDVYGDDFLCPALALVELSKVCPPPGVSAIPTYGDPYRQWPHEGEG